jgi:hypothetical protein
MCKKKKKKSFSYLNIYQVEKIIIILLGENARIIKAHTSWPDSGGTAHKACSHW